MTDLPRRKSPRLNEYDYRDPGSYFVTICLQDRSDLLATVDQDGILHRTEPGEMILSTWIQIPHMFSDVALDASIVMPDHIHGIVFVGVDPWSSRRTALTDLVRWFKSVSTTRYGSGVHEQGWHRFDRHLWQRSFYDRIIRDDADLQTCRSYIEANPTRWIERRSETD